MEPLWQQAAYIDWQQIPSAYHSWLKHIGSLTEKLRHISHRQVQHELLFEGWEDECWVRKIHFFYQNQSWEWAKTVIPKNSLKGKGLQLKQLGNQPIGDILFQDPHLKRSSFEIAKIKKGSIYFDEINSLVKDDHFWLRRSTFYFYRKPLVIIEALLPKLVEINQ